MRTERRAMLTMAALGLSILLAACQSEKKAATGGSAGGEILPGTASDAMIPVDSVRSQPPLAPKPTASAGEGRQKPKAGQSVTEEAPAEQAAPAEESPAAPAEAE